jgi:hypothetical protein
MAVDPERVKALFLAAILRESPADRRSFLDHEVGEDAELRRRHDSLPAAYDQLPGALERPLGGNLEATEALDGARLASSRHRGQRQRPASPPAERTMAVTARSIRSSAIVSRFARRSARGHGDVFFAEQLRPCGGTWRSS